MAKAVLATLSPHAERLRQRVSFIHHRRVRQRFDMRAGRARSKIFTKTRQGVLVALGVNLNGSVVIVPDPPCNLKRPRPLANEPAKPHSLNAT